MQDTAKLDSKFPTPVRNETVAPKANAPWRFIVPVYRDHFLHSISTCTILYFTPFALDTLYNVRSTYKLPRTIDLDPSPLLHLYLQKDLRSYHATTPRSMPISSIDPSLAVGFYIADR